MTRGKLLYAAKAHTTGGREGESRTSDGRLAVKLSSPGTPGDGTNPEQLFAAGWSACFESAMAGVARHLKVTLPPDLAIDAEVELWNGEDGYYLKGRLNVSAPGLSRETAQAIVEAASHTCPYSKAIKGNVDAQYVVV
jgi:Ohr subfamily peroxiredoxin